MHRALLLAAAALLLAGCLTQPPRASRSDIAHSFAFIGRIVVRQGDQRYYLKIDWSHAPRQDTILLATPLGQGVAEIMRTPAGASLQLADKRRIDAHDWSSLAEQAFGFRLPLDASPRWLLGDIPGDTEGWQIRVLERAGDTPDALPLVIELERDDLQVRLKVDEWIME